MRRLNRWVLLSVLGAFVAGGFVGWIVTDIGCATDDCSTSAIFIGFVSGLVAATGVGVVVVLADLSLREHRESAVEPSDE